MRPRAIEDFGAPENFIVGEKDDAGEEGTDPQSEEGETRFAGVEVVDALEDERVGFKKEVEDGVDEGEVHACGHDDGFGEDHSKRASENHGEELAGAFLLEFDGGEDILIGVLAS